MRHSKPVRLETAPTGGRKCLFIFRIHHNIIPAGQKCGRRDINLDRLHPKPIPAFNEEDIRPIVSETRSQTMKRAKVEICFFHTIQLNLSRLRPNQKQRTSGAKFPTQHGITPQGATMEVTVLVQRIRFELIRLRFDQLLETRIVSNGDERLDVELKAQRLRSPKRDAQPGSSRLIKRQ